MENNQPEVNPVQPGTKPNEGQDLQPSNPGTEVNPAEVGNNTEVDLDTQKIKTYPPETH